MSATLKLFAPLAVAVLLAGGVCAEDKKPAFIGVQIKAGDDAKSLTVQDTLPDSPAAKAGLKTGDEIVKLDGKEITDVEAFVKAVRAHKAGDTIKVTVKRDGKEKEIKITAGSPPEPKPTDK